MRSRPLLVDRSAYPSALTEGASLHKVEMPSPWIIFRIPAASSGSMAHPAAGHPLHRGYSCVRLDQYPIPLLHDTRLRNQGLDSWPPSVTHMLSLID